MLLLKKLHTSIFSTKCVRETLENSVCNPDFARMIRRKIGIKTFPTYLNAKIQDSEKRENFTKYVHVLQNEYWYDSSIKKLDRTFFRGSAQTGRGKT